MKRRCARASNPPGSWTRDEDLVLPGHGHERPAGTGDVSGVTSPANGRSTANAADFTPERYLRGQAALPRDGWRRFVYWLTGGRINFEPSPAELAERQLVARSASMQLIQQIVMSPSLDSARAASSTLDWLNENGHCELVRNAIAVREGLVEVEKFEEHFQWRYRAVVQVPWPPHLSAGTKTQVDRSRPRYLPSVLGGSRRRGR